MNTYHRFELAFDGDPQYIGFMQGLEDVGLPINIESRLHQPFDDNLKSPIIRGYTQKPVEFWFTDLGLKTFWPAILDIAKEIEEYDWSLLYLSKIDDISTAIYRDSYQAAWHAPAEPRNANEYLEISVSDASLPLVG